MTVDQQTRGRTTSPRSTATTAHELIIGLDRRPWGQVSPSIYETGRLVALAPWLSRHTARIDFLLDTQHPDGGWGAPDGYGLVPTASATEALLTILARHHHDGGPSPTATLTSAVTRGLRVLAGWSRSIAPGSVPDTPAADLIVPALIASINRRLSELRETPLGDLDGWHGDTPLELPAGMDGRRLAAVRHLLATGAPVPEKLLHALEVAADIAYSAAGVQPAAPGTIGASPAATAAWLGGPGQGEGQSSPDRRAAAGAARAYLETVVGQYSGPAPCATPITVFERAWVLSTLLRAGVPVSVTPTLVRSLSASLGPVGAAAGPGLPADADTTSVTLYALGLLGRPVDPECLLRYRTADAFCTWPGEDGYSITTNAHVLDALGQHASRSTPATGYREIVERLSDWLLEHQQPDGRWMDRWHASSYYATACCALALHGYGRTSAAEGIKRAVDWILATQRPDGSWGRWAGTVEETAYALLVLLATDGAARRECADAAVRGYSFLLENADDQEQPPLWHDKDLYRPDAIIRSATLAAFQMVESRPDLMARLKVPT